MQHVCDKSKHAHYGIVCSPIFLGKMSMFLCMLQCRSGLATQAAAIVDAPAAFVIYTWLPVSTPLSKFTRRMLVAVPAGMKMIVSWPPAYSNQTALDYVANITADSGYLSQAVNADPVLNALGPVKVPMGSVIITQTYAPSPPALAQPPPPPAPLGSQPMSPEDTPKYPVQVSFGCTERVAMAINGCS